MNNQNDEYETLEELDEVEETSQPQNSNTSNNNTSNFFKMPEQEVMPPKEQTKLGKLLSKIKSTINSGIEDIESSSFSKGKTPSNNNQITSNNTQNTQNNTQGFQNNNQFNQSNNQNANNMDNQMPSASSQEQFFVQTLNEEPPKKVKDEPPKRGKFFGFFPSADEQSTQNEQENDSVKPWMNNQPLSMDTLGVTANTNEEEEDETLNSRFLNPSAFEGSKGIVDRSLNLPKLKQKKEKSNNGTLLLNYLGEDYSRITMNPFSMSGLLTGGLYLFNHKVHLLGLILFALEIYILIFMPFKIAIIAIIVYVLVLGFISNEIIYTSAKIKVALIRKLHPKDHEVLLVERASKKGGTHLLLTLIVFALGVALGVYAVGFKNYNSGLIGKGVSFAETKIYELRHPFTIAFDSGVKIEDEFNITIPEDMTKQEGTTFYYAYKEKYMEINLCTYEFGLLRTYTDMDEFLTELKKKYKIETTEEIEINNLKWQFATLKDEENGTTTWRATTIDNRIFLMISYQNLNDTSKICDTYFDEIYSSISTK